MSFPGQVAGRFTASCDCAANSEIWPDASEIAACCYCRCTTTLSSAETAPLVSPMTACRIRQPGVDFAHWRAWAKRTRLNSAVSRGMTGSERQIRRRPATVESGCGAVAVGLVCLLPPLSSGGAQLTWPWLRFHTPLIEPDLQISRIRLSDRTSRLRPRVATLQASEAYETQGLVQVRV